MNSKWTKVWINLICYRIFNQLSTEWSCIAIQSMYRFHSIRHPLQSRHRSITARTSPSLNDHCSWHTFRASSTTAPPGRWQLTWFESVSKRTGISSWPRRCEITDVHWMGMMTTDLCSCRRWPHFHCARIISIFMDWSGEQDIKRRQLFDDMAVFWEDV